MADTIKTQIIDHVISTCNAIASGATYTRTVKTASRDMVVLNNLKAYDCVCVERTREVKRLLCANVTQVQLTIWLWALCQDSDTGTATDALAADIEKALMADETRGDLAISTRIMSTEDESLTEVAERLGAVLIEIAVLFQHKDGDPYTAVGG